MSKVYLVPANKLNMEDLRKAFKKAKADARRDNGSKDMQQVSENKTS